MGREWVRGIMVKGINRSCREIDFGLIERNDYCFNRDWLEWGLIGSDVFRIYEGIKVVLVS